jgi:hypothetical protein
VTQPTAESRTQLLLTIVAIAVGGGMFALAGDFVIGVVVAAAVFAVGRQALYGPAAATIRPAPLAALTTRRRAASRPGVHR